METDSLVIQTKSLDFQYNTTKDIETRCDLSSYEEKKKISLPIGKNKKVIGLMKDEMGGKTLTEFVAVKLKTYAVKIQKDEYEKKSEFKKAQDVKGQHQKCQLVGILKNVCMILIIHQLLKSK